MDRTFFMLASMLGFFGVVIGAFSAHALKQKMPPEMFAIFEVGVRYHFYHVFALFVAAWASQRWHAGFAQAAGWLFFAGVFVFSGSLYVLSLTGYRLWGAVTPFGGLMFLGGWACLALAAWR